MCSHSPANSDVTYAFHAGKHAIPLRGNRSQWLATSHEKLLLEIGGRLLITFIAITTAVNIALGYWLAIYLGHAPLRIAGSMGLARMTTPGVALQEEQADADRTESPAADIAAVAEQQPAETPAPAEQETQETTEPEAAKSAVPDAVATETESAETATQTDATAPPADAATTEPDTDDAAASEESAEPTAGEVPADLPADPDSQPPSEEELLAEITEFREQLEESNSASKPDSEHAAEDKATVAAAGAETTAP